MTTMQIAGRLLAADTDNRTLTYRLLPYGEGRTNLGKVLASRGCLTLPDNPAALKLNDRHIANRELATGTSLEWGPDALIASFHVHDGPAGDALLEEAEQAKTNPTPGVELRAAASVEVDNPVIRAGKLLAGFLSGAAAVVRPAFDGATLLAADAGDLPEDFPDYLKPTESTSESTEEIVINGVTYVVKRTSTSKTEVDPKDPTAQAEDQDAEQSAESETEMGNTLTAAAAAGMTQTPHGGAAKTKSAEEVFRLLASAFRSGGDQKLMAALTNVVHDDGDNDGDGLGEITAAPEWLGEVWAQVPYVRKWIPLIASAPLTSYRQLGFHFGTKPLVQKYAGNKAEVPSNGMTATPVNYVTQRWAHAADLDRRYIDFGDSDVLRAFTEAQLESYRKETDLDTHDGLFTAASAFTPGSVPSGIDAGLAALIDGALDLIGRDLNPTFAIVGKGLYRNLLFTMEQKGLKFLTMALGLEEGALDGFKIRPSGRAAATNKVLVGDGSTVVFKEFGGGTPVRVDAEHVANGGRDLGLFGYTSLQKRTPSTVAGLVVADLTPAG